MSPLMWLRVGGAFMILNDLKVVHERISSEL
jgi:hypothetical protein